MKPGKAKIIKVVIVLIVMVIWGAQCWQYRGYYLSLENPFKTSTEFEKLYYATFDRDNNIYRIDMSQKRITETSAKGNLELEINLNHSGKQTGKFFCLAVGDNSTIYATKATGDSKKGYTEQIVRYTNNSQREIYTVKQNDKVENEYKEKIAYMYFKDNILFFIEIEDINKQKRVHFKKILAKDGTPLGSEEFDIPKNCDLNKITGIYPDNIYFTSKEGQIYKWFSATSQFKNIYPSTAQENSCSNPVFLAMYDDNHLVYVDVREKNICMLENDISRGLITEEENLIKKDSLIAESISTTDERDIVCVMSDNVVSIKLDKSRNLNSISEVDSHSNTAKYKTIDWVKRILLWVFPIILATILIYLLFLLYKYYIRKKIVRKQISLILGVGVVIFILVMSILRGQFESILTDKIHRQLDSKVNIGVSQLNMDDFESIKFTSDFNGDAYKRLHDYINMIQEDNVGIKTSNDNEPTGSGNAIQRYSNSLSKFFRPEFSQEQFYSIIYKIDKMGEKKYIFNMCVTDDDHRSPFHPYFIPEADDLTKYSNAVYYKNTEFFEKQSDATGDYMVIIKPIKSKNNDEVVGLYEIGIDRSALTEYIKTILYSTLALILLSLILCIVGIGILTSRLLAPLGQLKEEVEMMDGKTWSDPLSIHTGDELEGLSNSFNNMNNILKDYINEIEETKTAYARFVPHQINQILGKDKITKIELANQNALKMCLMVSNIRSFYSLSGKMTAQENFDFINSYLNQIGPVIPKFGGFIDEYLGYGVMALFSDSHQADNSLQAALMMQRRIKEFNRILAAWGKETFQIGVAVHLCEKLILGIVGFKNDEEDRLEAAVIDEGVILTEAMEKSAARLGATILATEELIGNLQSPSKYQYRYLGLISFEDIEKPVEIYDVYQEDDEIIRKAKEKTKEKFENAVSLYQNKDFQKARNIFVDVIGENDKDEAAKIYFFLCDEYIKKEPRNWGKAISL